jgi:hypothetical protein
MIALSMVKARKCCSKIGKREMFAGPLLRVRELRIIAQYLDILRVWSGKS